MSLPLPGVPLTLEGSYVLHQMFRVKRTAWKKAPEGVRLENLREAAEVLGEMESTGPEGSAVFSVIGHKGDLMFLHFRPSLEALHAAELRIKKLDLAEFLEETHSYLSVIELGLYESSAKTYTALADKGLAPGTGEWDAGLEEVLARQRLAMAPRLTPEIPNSRYVCFYPMDRRRGEDKNWYSLTLSERQRQMHEHGMIGRRYADAVRQIISGSIGLDDWEWGVDLFAEDPLVFKKLIYEMRFDEVSAVYGLFGSFYVGLRVPAAEISLAL